MAGGIISAMKVLTLGKFRFLALLWAAVTLVVVAWAKAKGTATKVARKPHQMAIRMV